MKLVICFFCCPGHDMPYFAIRIQADMSYTSSQFPFMESETARSSRHRRIILFPFSFQGHINPMLQLANLLYSKGFSITIIHTTFNAPKTSNFPNFTFRSFLDNDPVGQRFSSTSAQGIYAFAEKFYFNQSNGADALLDVLKLLLDSEKDEPVSCLITDAVWHFTQSVADSLNLPRLVLRTCSLFCTLVYAAIPLLDDLGYFKLDNTHFEEQVVEFPLLKVRDILKMGNKRDPVPDLIENIVKQMKACSGIIWNSFKELEAPELQTVLHDFPVTSFLIPLPMYFTASSSSLLEQDQSVIPWLNHQPPNSVLYISFGSISYVDENDFLEIAHGLINSKQTFLWVVRPGFVNGSTWLESLPDGFLGEKGLVVKWAHQPQVLAHEAIGAFWTHSGWNSSLESVCEGVPMICSPFKSDQPLNARYMSDVAKVAVYLEHGYNREEITNAIRKVMVDKEGEDIKEMAKVLKQKLYVSVLNGGSSYESLESLLCYISSF